MADLTLAQLLATPTVDQVRDRILGKLNIAGFTITDWETGGAQRTMFEAFAAALYDFVANMLPVITAGGFTDEAKGDWLALLAKQDRDLTKRPASYSVQQITLVADPGVGPYTQNTGDLIAESASGNRYTLDQAITIPVGILGGLGVLSRFKAQSPGAAFADEAGSIVRLITPLPGVSIENRAPLFSVVTQLGSGTGTVVVAGTPAGARRFVLRIKDTGQADATATFEYSMDGAPFVTGGVCVATGYVPLPGGTQVTFVNAASPSFVAGDQYIFSTPGSPTLIQGQDEESDPELQARMHARWPALAEVPTSEKYALWVQEAASEITKVTVKPQNSATTPGRVGITIAGYVNPLSGATIATAQAFVDTRAPITDDPVVSAATVQIIHTSGSAIVKAKDLEAVQTKATAIWKSYLDGLPIGGLIRGAKLAQAVMDAGALSFFNLVINIIDPVDMGSSLYSDYQLPDGVVASAYAGGLISDVLWSLE